jgi:RNA polymerase sigma-70 factor (ECF subfamily)
VALTDDDEMAQFLAGPYASIVRAVALITQSGPAAEDAVHEAIARALERRRSIENLDRWIVTTALNLARSRRRKLTREVTSTDIAEIAGEQDVAVSLDIRRALADLPARQREVAVLHYLLDWSVADVALSLGLSEGGTKHALYRARASLAAAITPEHQEHAHEP